MDESRYEGKRMCRGINHPLSRTLVGQGGLRSTDDGCGDEDEAGRISRLCANNQRSSPFVFDANAHCLVKTIQFGVGGGSGVKIHAKFDVV